MILEGIVTTQNEDGGPHVSPMGPIVDESMATLILRPFSTSTTYRNLRRTGSGVFHVTDDVLLMAHTAIGSLDRLDPPPSLCPCDAAAGWILNDACRWYAFQVDEIDETEPRATMRCRVVATGRQRDFFGFNRAKHAVVEAAILATRVHLLPGEEIARQMKSLAVPVEKTAGPRERAAFALLDEFIRTRIAAPPPRTSSAQSFDRVRVVAPCRLHFGLLSFGGSCGRDDEVRQFGGAGMMVDEPAVDLTLVPADRFSAAGPMADRVAEFARRWTVFYTTDRSSPSPPLPRVCISVERSAPQHVGLGVGTQLALAVAAALNTAHRRACPPPEELARSVGRGLRSAVGTYGFLHGGLIVERGKRNDEGLAPLDAQLDLPDAWRVVLIRPCGESGLCGGAEQGAFDQLPAVPPDVTRRLEDELRSQLVPAAARGDFDAFSESVYRYGHQAGLCFASVQGGAYNGPRLEDLADRIRRLGVVGVGQSSWGPTLFAILEDDDRATWLRQALIESPLPFDCHIAITRPQNHGAEVLVTP